MARQKPEFRYGFDATPLSDWDDKAYLKCAAFSPRMSAIKDDQFGVLLLVLKQSTNERDKVFRINAFACAFSLLDRLAQKKNKESAAVYKTVILALIEHYKHKRSDREVDQTTTDMALKNFIHIFKTHDSIPKHVMLDPFIDQMLQNIKTYK